MILIPQSNPFAATPGIVHEILTDAADDESISKVGCIGGNNNTAPVFFFCATSDTPNTPLTGGNVTIEMNPDPLSIGGWAEIISFDVTAITIVGNTGVEEEDDVPWTLNGCGFRARIDEAITGGTITIRVAVGKFG